MIAQTRNGSTVTDNMPGEAYQAGIDDEDMAHVIGLFTDLYSDPVKAVIREYSTNGLDAQIEAGYTGPIEVTLPTHLSPIFTVQDYGVGLMSEDIRRIYSRYGKSTKRATNDQNGMLGLGCKSALTYTEQFTVESVCNGVRTICAISRTDGGVPMFKVVDTRATTERNGTKVVIPTKGSSDFTTKAAEFYSHWKPGTVLVNGKQPEPVEGLRVGTDFIVTHENGYGTATNYCVMGNVAYPIDRNQFDSGLPYSYAVVMHVPIGSVSFTPSREALMYTPATKATLADAGKRFRAELQAAIAAEIDKAPTRREAIQAAQKWKGLAGRRHVSSFQWRGQDIPASVGSGADISPRNSHKMGASSWNQSVDSAMIPHTLFVVGWDVEKFTANHKRKLLQFCAEQNIAAEDSAYFAMLGLTSFSHPWVEPKQVVQWEDVKKVKLPRPTYVKGASGRIPGSYDVYIDGEPHWGYPADDIDQTKTVLYFEGNSSQAYRVRTVAEAILGDHTLVLLPANRVEKFKRNFPNAKCARSAVWDSWHAWAAKLTADQRDALAIHDRNEKVDYKAFGKGTIPIADPVIRRGVKLVEIDLTKLLEERKLYGEFGRGADGWKCPLASYPLYDFSVLRTNPDHVITYINAAYAAERQEA